MNCGLAFGRTSKTKFILIRLRFRYLSTTVGECNVCSACADGNSSSIYGGTAPFNQHTPIYLKCLHRLNGKTNVIICVSTLVLERNAAREHPRVMAAAGIYGRVLSFNLSLASHRVEFFSLFVKPFYICNVHFTPWALGLAYRLIVRWFKRNNSKNGWTLYMWQYFWRLSRNNQHHTEASIRIITLQSVCQQRQRQIIQHAKHL